MVLYLIGLGLWDEKDISIKGLEAIKNCDEVYLEYYTSKLSCSIADLEKLYGKKITLANRTFIENGSAEIVDKAKTKNIAILVIGDPFGATTHTGLKLEAINAGVQVNVIHNASILNSIGIVGLELYKFGKITSIPFENQNVKTPIEVFETNQKIGLHTLFLLDLRPDEDRFMTINEAVSYLIKNRLSPKQLCIGCAGIGSGNPEIKSGSGEKLLTTVFSLYPQCLIIPGKMHFVEEEAVEFYKY